MFAVIMFFVEKLMDIVGEIPVLSTIPTVILTCLACAGYITAPSCLW